LPFFNDAALIRMTKSDRRYAHRPTTYRVKKPIRSLSVPVLPARYGRSAVAETRFVHNHLRTRISMAKNGRGCDDDRAVKKGISIEKRRRRAGTRWPDRKNGR